MRQAEARLQQAGQGVGASTASVEAAQAKLDEARAAAANVRVQSERVLELVRRGVYPRAREDDAIAAIDEAQATVESAEADLRRAREELGPEGKDNPQIREAISALDQARYDLSRTSVVAPSRGVVTNLQLAGGQVVVAGQPVMTFISAEDVWLLASLRENSLGVLEPGQPAEVVLDTLPGQVFSAEVRSVGWGVASSNVDPATGLPKTTSEDGWLTDPQRFPVHLLFDREHSPTGARYGSRAAVIVYAGETTGEGPILRLGETGRMFAVAEVYETDARFVREGQRAVVTSPALPQDLHGEVVWRSRLVHKNDVLGIDPAADTDTRVMETRIRIDEADVAAGFVHLQVDVEIDIQD